MGPHSKSWLPNATPKVIRLVSGVELPPTGKLPLTGQFPPTGKLPLAGQFPLTGELPSVGTFFKPDYQLTPEEATAFGERLGQESKGVREMEYSYFGKVRQEGLQEGLQQGLQGMHFILLEMLHVKFGELPQDITDQVKAIESQEELTTLATKARSAESLADLGLNGPA